MVFAHFGAERYAGGVVWARRLIEKQPENLMANYLLVAASAMQKNSVMAAEALARLLRLRPNFSLAWVNSTTPLIGWPIAFSKVCDRPVFPRNDCNPPSRRDPRR